MDTTPAANTRSRKRTSSQMAPPAEMSSQTTTAAAPSARPRARLRNPPYLPTPTEALVLASYPALLIFGAVYSLANPETRAGQYDIHAQSFVQDGSSPGAVAPSYFARKDNLLNVVFVKRGWAWITGAFVLFLLTHPALAPARMKAQAGVRWALVTASWILVTQWCFGPPIIDRSFRYTGGKCDAVEQRVAAADGPGDVAASELWTAVACKSAGRRWSGGHDISGHVFMLVLGSFFLWQEIGWAVRLWMRPVEERTVVMHDGAIKSADVERTAATAPPARGLGFGRESGCHPWWC